MYRRRWPTIRRALLAGLVIWGFATLLEPTTSPSIQAVLQNTAERQVVTIENAREAPSAPAALTKAMTSTERKFTLSNRAQAPKEQNDTTAVGSTLSNPVAPQAIAEKEEALSWVRVDGSVVNVRSGPRTSAQRIGSFPEGTRLRVIERGEKWAKIKDPETGQSGWMHRDYLARVTGGNKPTS